MSDSVLAAIIAATATLCASFLQLRSALAKDADARSRGQPISRRRSRLPMILIGIMMVASAVGGFSLSQWLGDSNRVAQADLQRELRERIDQLGQALARLEQVTVAQATAKDVPVVPQEDQPAALATPSAVVVPSTIESATDATAAPIVSLAVGDVASPEPSIERDENLHRAKL